MLCLLAFTAGHLFNYTVILYLQEAKFSDLLGPGFWPVFGSSIVFGLVCRGGVRPGAAAPGDSRRPGPVPGRGLACFWWAHSGASDENRVAWCCEARFAAGWLGLCSSGALTTCRQLALPDEPRAATIVFNPQGAGGLWRSPCCWVRCAARPVGVPLALAAGGWCWSSLLLAGLRTRRSPTQRPNGGPDGGRRISAPGQDAPLAQLMLAAVLAYASDPAAANSAAQTGARR